MPKQGCNEDGVVYTYPYVERAPIEYDCSQDGCTRQEFAAECDINTLMQKYEATGVINHINRMPPAYLDVTNVPDLQQAIHIMQAAERAFMTLPASVRKEFDNDPVRFVDYAQDPGNVDKMREWGLAAPAKPADAEIPPAPSLGVVPPPEPPPAKP